MKLKTLLIGIIFAASISLTGCNYKYIDTTYNFDYAMIAMPDGSIVEGKVESWRDYEDGEQLQVKINGVTYLTSSYNCVLMNKGK